MMTEEFKSKLLLAQSAEEVAGLLKNVGMDESKVGQIWNEISSHRAEKELSLDQLEAVSGGQKWGNGVWVRDYSTEGCTATVEPGSDCWGTDGNCWIGNISYIPGPIDFKCPDCGVYCYESGPNHYVTCQACRKGYRLTDYITGPIIGT